MSLLAEVSSGPVQTSYHGETHGPGSSRRTNWLRAGVLGANDGIISLAGLVVGVAGASASRGALVTAGLAGLVAGALSMGVGEYVSVSTQRDTERSQLLAEQKELDADPEGELDELIRLLERRGVHALHSRPVAEQLTAHDAFGAHARAELGIDPEALVNPWAAAAASIASFALGALLPLLAIVLPPAPLRLAVTVVAVLLALALTGWLSARLGGAPRRPAIARVVAGGGAAMLITYVVGRLVGATL